MTQASDTSPIDNGPVTDLATLGDAGNMREALKAFNECRQVVLEYIADQFVEGVDFGPSDPRSDKKTLLKAGAEKVGSLFNTRLTWEMDRETWEMLGSPAGTVCYVCRIVSNATGNVVGEGRGAESVGNKKRDANKAIKIAEKCAAVDAALYTFRLSELFTQDMGTNGYTGKPDVGGMKDLLLADVTKARQGIQSSLTDRGLLAIVVKAELHKEIAETQGEVEHIGRVILRDKLYDLATGEKFGTGPNAGATVGGGQGEETPPAAGDPAPPAAGPEPSDEPERTEDGDIIPDGVGR